MAIIRRIRFTQSGDINPDDISLIDTPEKLLKFAELRELDTYPLDMEGVADNFGILIERVALEDDLSGILYKDKENDTWVMQINENHHPNRQRYTIAH